MNQVKRFVNADGNSDVFGGHVWLSVPRSYINGESLIHFLAGGCMFREDGRINILARDFYRHSIDLFGSDPDWLKGALQEVREARQAGISMYGTLSAEDSMAFDEMLNEQHTP